jgi:guanine deaminase
MKLFYGHFIHSLSLNELEIENGFILINQSGVIIDIKKSVDDNEVENQFKEYKLKNKITEIIIMNKNQFLIPGFIDSHFHAPQIVNLGRGHELTLLDWLNKYTFPKEAEFKDIKYAEFIYSNLVKRLLKHGTTTISYFSTIHLEATKVLADCMKKYGQRGYVGKVCMDRNSPDYYIETHESCIKDNIELIEYLKDSTLIRPIITPRFAISCSSELLNSLGNVAKEYELQIQSHLSENKNEIKMVRKLFPNLNYTEVYDAHNLLNEKTIMAHCVHLTNKEIALIKKRKAGVSHCPTSNINLMSGFLDVKNLLKQNIKVGLGTDVSGGSY